MDEVAAQRGCPVPAPEMPSGGRPDALAPGHPTKTRFCVYQIHGFDLRGERVYPGGPLDRVLNGSLSRYPPGIACAGVATLPTVIVLVYKNAPTRHIAVNVGGCSLTTAHRTSRVLLRDLLSDYQNVFKR